MSRLVQSNLAKALGVIVPLAALVVLWMAGAVTAGVADVMEIARDRGPNEIAENEQTRNYYEEAMDADRGQWGRGGIVRLVSNVLSKRETGRDKGNWIRLQETGATRDLEGEFLGYELVPGAEVVHMGVPVKVNRWGQRDHDYEQARPPGTFRICLVGGSNTMGYGVELDGTFGEIVERRLNEELAGRAYERYELINFAVGGYQLLDRLWVVENRMAAFEPDLILVSVTMHDLRWAVHQRLAMRVASGRDVHFDFVRSIMAEAGVEPGLSEIKARQRLNRYREALVQGAFEELRRQSEALGAPAVALMLRLRVNEPHETSYQQAELAAQAGLPVLRIFDAYEGRSGEEMYLRPTDQHPSALAHRLIADELFEKMLGDPRIRAMLLDQDQPPREETEAP